jgi:hypothetical protein
MIAEHHQGNGGLYFLVKLLDEWDQMWYNSIHVYLYLEVINYSFSPIFWVPLNQFSASTLQKDFFHSFGGDILVANNTLR